MKKSGIIGGIILILLGAVILLRTFGLIYFSWWSLWRMWPFIFVFIGISMLPVKSWIKSLIYIISILACIGLMVYVEKDNPRPHRNWRDHFWHWDGSDVREFKKEIKEKLRSSDQALYLNFADSIGTLQIDANLLSGEYLFKGKPGINAVQCYFYGAQYSSSFHTEGEKGFIEIVPESYKANNNEGKIFLDEKKSYVFHVKSESAEVNMDLFRIKTDTLHIEAGANSEWEITLSNRNPETHIFVQADPSTAEISFTLPKGMGYNLLTNETTDFESTSGDVLVHEGQVTRTDDFDAANTKLFIVSNTDKIAISQK